MSSILHSERHLTALRLEKEIIGDPPHDRPVKPGSKYVRAERAIGKFLRYELDEQELRETLEAIAATASKMPAPNFSALRAAAAQIKPRDLIVVVEKFRKLDEDSVPDGRVSPGNPIGQLPTGPMRMAHPVRPAKTSDLTDQKLQNQVACDICGKLIDRVIHSPLPSSADDGRKS